MSERQTKAGNQVHSLDMLNMLLFIAKNCNAFFLTATLSREFGVYGAGSQLKMSERQTKAGNQITLSLSLTISLFLTLTLIQSLIQSLLTC